MPYFWHLQKQKLFSLAFSQDLYFSNLKSEFYKKSLIFFR